MVLIKRTIKVYFLNLDHYRLLYSTNVLDFQQTIVKCLIVCTFIFAIDFNMNIEHVLGKSSWPAL